MRSRASRCSIVSQSVGPFARPPARLSVSSLLTRSVHGLLYVRSVVEADGRSMNSRSCLTSFACWSDACLQPSTITLTAESLCRVSLVRCWSIGLNTRSDPWDEKRATYAEWRPQQQNQQTVVWITHTNREVTASDRSAADLPVLFRLTTSAANRITASCSSFKNQKRRMK